MEHRHIVALQCASIALLSVSLLYFYRTRRRNLRKASLERNKDLLNWNRELEGLEEGDEDEDEEDDEDNEAEAIGEGKGEEKNVRGRASRLCTSNDNTEKKSCGSCKPKLPSSHRKRKEEGSVKHQNRANRVLNLSENPIVLDVKSLNSIQGKVIYASQTGRSKALAEKLVRDLLVENAQVELLDPMAYEPEDLAQEKFVVFVVSTWENGLAPDHASFLGRWLEESSADFRVSSWLLNQCKYAIFGIGSSAYGSSYNMVARSWDQHMSELGASRILDREEGDEDEGLVDEKFKEWTEKLIRKLKSLNGSPLQMVLEEEGNIDDAFDSDDDDDYDEDEDEDDKENMEEELVDVEDIGGKFDVSGKNDKVLLENGKQKIYRRKNQSKVVPSVENGNQGPKEMVTPTIRANLEKQV